MEKNMSIKTESCVNTASHVAETEPSIFLVEDVFNENDGESYRSLYHATIASLVWLSRIIALHSFRSNERDVRRVMAEAWFFDSGVLRADEMARINAMRVELYLRKMSKGLGLDEIVLHLSKFFIRQELQVVGDPGIDVKRPPEAGWLFLSFINHPGVLYLFGVKLNASLSEAAIEAISVGAPESIDRWPMVVEVSVESSMNTLLEQEADQPGYLAQLESESQGGQLLLGAKLLAEVNCI
jgi:hypothetical protein